MKSVLMYDGECSFCSGVVRFVLAHERRRELLFAPLGGGAARRILAGREGLLAADTVFWVELDETGAPVEILDRSAAVLRLARYLGGWWRLLAVLRAVPRPLRDAVYNAVARNRHRIAGSADCFVPSADVRGRFLDDSP